MTIKCQNCISKRIMNVQAKCSDMFCCQIGEKEHNGYVPTDIVFGKGGFGDYIRFDLCLDCGYIQGEWPHPLIELEREGELESEEG